MPELRQPITETGENILFRSHAVVVTDKRLLFETKSVALSAVSTVKVESPGDRGHARGAAQPAGSMPGVGVVLGGLGFALVGVYVGWGTPVLMGIFAFLGALVAAVGGVILAKSGVGRASRKRKRKSKGYSVKIHTVDGQKTRITGLKLRDAQQVANVISAAATRL
jgi:hypothetical protein